MGQVRENSFCPDADSLELPDIEVNMQEKMSPMQNIERRLALVLRCGDFVDRF
jgi:hypothetical protein